jgi:hypothetical protein
MGLGAEELTERPDPGEQPSVMWRPLDAVARADVAAAVFDTLAARDEDVARWYRGALETPAVANHSDAFAQAAHGLREVMNRVKSSGGAAVPPAGGLGHRFQTLVTACGRAQERSRCFHEGRWSGDIDEHAWEAFEVVEETIEWHRTFMPTRRRAFIRAARQLDPSGRALPESEEQRLWRAWSDTKEYFDAVAHQASSCACSAANRFRQNKYTLCGTSYFAVSKRPRRLQIHQRQRLDRSRQRHHRHLRHRLLTTPFGIDLPGAQSWPPRPRSQEAGRDLHGDHSAQSVRLHVSPTIPGMAANPSPRERALPDALDDAPSRPSALGSEEGGQRLGLATFPHSLPGQPLILVRLLLACAVLVLAFPFAALGALLTGGAERIARLGALAAGRPKHTRRRWP